MEHTVETTLSFASLIPSTQTNPVPAWAKNITSVLAHGDGRLPEHVDQLGWQPVAGPGAPVQGRQMTSSMELLRKRMVRGEA